MRKFGKSDICLLSGLCIIALVLLILFLRIDAKTGNQVEISVDKEVYGIYDLFKDQKIPVKIDGKVTNTVVIDHQKVYMQEASCPDHLCEKQGVITGSGKQIVCLPNRVVVQILSEDETQFDSISN